MSEKTPTLEEIKQNLLEVRNHTHFNIGSPQAIDHLLISLVAVIDALDAPKAHPNQIPNINERGRE